MMESTWYYFPGQTETNTKVDDRPKALITKAEEWTRITRHLEQKEIQERIRAEEEKKRQFLKETSHEMTKNWENSIEKMRQRRLENLTKRAQEREANLVQRYLQLRKEQEQERNELVAQAQKRMYMMQKEKSRELNSSLLLSEVLYERQLQLQFNQLEKEHEAIEAAKYAALIKQNAIQEKLENKEKAQKRREVNLKHRVELKEQIQKLIDKDKKEKEERLEMERISNIRAKEEMDEIKQYEQKLDKDKKADVKQQFHDFHTLKTQHKEEERKQEETETKIRNIYTRAKCRIQNKIKQRLIEYDNENIKKLERVAGLTTGHLEAKLQKEDEIAEKACKELEKRELKVIAKQEQYQQKLLQERLEYRKQCLEQKRKEVLNDKEIRKWELLNRFKTDEVQKKYELDRKQNNFDKKIAYRQQLFKQVDELKQEILNEKKHNRIEFEAYKKKLESDDNAFFQYADEVLALAKSRGRSLKPILKVIEKYKIANNLERTHKRGMAKEEEETEKGRNTN